MLLAHSKSHMSTTQVPSTSHPWACTKWPASNNTGKQIPATVLSDRVEQFLLSWTGIFAHWFFLPWRRGGKTWWRRKRSWLFTTPWTGGRRNPAYKAHRKPEAHPACWDCVCVLVISCSMWGTSISNTNRWEAGNAEVFLTGQNLSGYKEMELPRQRAHEKQPILMKEPL